MPLYLSLFPLLLLVLLLFLTQLHQSRCPPHPLTLLPAATAPLHRCAMIVFIMRLRAYLQELERLQRQQGLLLLEQHHRQ